MDPDNWTESLGGKADLVAVEIGGDEKEAFIEWYAKEV